MLKASNQLLKQVSTVFDMEDVGLQYQVNIIISKKMFKTYAHKCGFIYSKNKGKMASV